MKRAKQTTAARKADRAATEAFLAGFERLGTWSAEAAASLGEMVAAIDAARVALGACAAEFMRQENERMRRLLPVA